MRAKRIENSDNNPCEESSKPLHNDGNYEPIEYTRTLNKAVQNIRYHPMPKVPNCACIAAVVLPSMKKDHLYNICILKHRSTTQVIRACCTCSAGLL